MNDNAKNIITIILISRKQGWGNEVDRITTAMIAYQLEMRIKKLHIFFLAIVKG